MRRKGAHVIFKPVQIKKRGKSYQLYYYNPDGCRRRLSIGKDYQHAQRLAVKFSDWLLGGKNPECEIAQLQRVEDAKSITLLEFFPIFMERHGSLQSKKMQKLYEVCFNNIYRCESLAKIPIAKISKSLMLDYMHIRMNQDIVSAATVNREASFVKGMLSRASEWDILEHNPLQGLRLFRESEKREVHITTEQAGLLIAELPEPLANITAFAIYSGIRKENILDLRIKQLCFHDLTETGEVELMVKGGKRELFPLCKHAVKVLVRAIGNRTEGYVFLNPLTKTRYVSIHKNFDKAVRKLNLTVNGTKLRFHDLRHIYGTWLLKSGVSLDVIRELMGHKDRSTTDRYAILDRKEAGQHLIAMPEIEIIKHPKITLAV